jgi:hypothetical protein
MGAPIVGYSLDIGRAHTDFAEAKMQKRLIERTLDEAEINSFAVMAMAGVSAEATKFEEVNLPLYAAFLAPVGMCCSDFLVSFFVYQLYAYCHHGSWQGALSFVELSAFWLILDIVFCRWWDRQRIWSTCKGFCSAARRS